MQFKFVLWSVNTGTSSDISDEELNTSVKLERTAGLTYGVAREPEQLVTKTLKFSTSESLIS